MGSAGSRRAVPTSFPTYPFVFHHPTNIVHGGSCQDNTSPQEIASKEKLVNKRTQNKQTYVNRARSWKKNADVIMFSTMAFSSSLWHCHESENNMQKKQFNILA